MSVLNEKVKILKCVYEIIEDAKLNEDLNSFSYEDMLERLIADKPDLDATHLLLQHGAFVVQQVGLNSFLIFLIRSSLAQDVACYGSG